ncbi:MAG: hypothetical protein ABTQ34_05990 [Bdellovibrionales bacterium]
MPISIDEAVTEIVEALRKLPPLLATHDPNLRSSKTGCDIKITEMFGSWWHKQHKGMPQIPDPGEQDYAPFHDAAWELARRGILRAGKAFPGLYSFIGGEDIAGNGYSLTEMGREWVAKYDQFGHVPVDPGRFAALIAPYAQKFGEAFIQRVSEAAGCYRTCNYLATCAMAGAACESILLALAIKKQGDEEAVLKAYLGRDGRQKLIKSLSGNLNGHMRQGIETATQILSYWRDNASHGHATTVSEFAAHDALSRLLRFAQFADGKWEVLTASEAVQAPNSQAL